MCGDIWSKKITLSASVIAFVGNVQLSLRKLQPRFSQLFKPTRLVEFATLLVGQ